MLSTTLFLGNLPEDVDDARLTEEMGKWPQLERCFVMRNKEGISKVRPNITVLPSQQQICSCLPLLVHRGPGDAGQCQC